MHADDSERLLVDLLKLLIQNFQLIPKREELDLLVGKLCLIEHVLS